MCFSACFISLPPFSQNRKYETAKILIATDSKGRRNMNYDGRNQTVNRVIEGADNSQPGLTTRQYPRISDYLERSKAIEQYVTPVLAEFVGTFVFVFIGAGSIVTNTFLHGATGLIGIALAHGLALSIVISAFGATSGGHINPAVTIGFLVTGRIVRLLGILYIVAELVGATLAGLLFQAM